MKTSTKVQISGWIQIASLALSYIGIGIVIGVLLSQ
jgi:hypothetical protein